MLNSLNHKDALEYSIAAECFQNDSVKYYGKFLTSILVWDQEGPIFISPFLCSVIRGFIWQHKIWSFTLRSIDGGANTLELTLIMVINVQGLLQVLVSFHGIYQGKLKCLIAGAILENFVFHFFHCFLLLLWEFLVLMTTGIIGQMSSLEVLQVCIKIN